jgi:N-acetylglucosaminyl-diphospho-decaprenol L-rhamnosyltransferase
MKSKELTIVIVAFKSDKKIISCLESISNKIPIIIVENSDNVDFKKKIESKFKNVNCILTGENKGYSIANNIGLKLVKSKYALVLNPDTVLEKNTIKNFFVFAELNKDFWLVGPASDQMVEIDYKSKNSQEVKNLKGFAIFFNMSKFNGEFFDENFFLYFEEIDLCKRIQINKGKIFLDKTIIINHEGGKSINNFFSFELEKNRNWHWMWSTFYFHKKYKGFFLATIIIFPKLLSALFKSIFYLIIFNKKKRDIYFHRLSGVLNSIAGKKSWYRPALD